jgi:hypothetical protein
VHVDDLTKGNVNFAEITGKYALVRGAVGVRGIDWEKSFAGLNIMAEKGWRLVEWIVSGNIMGFIVERTK